MKINWNIFYRSEKDKVVNNYNENKVEVAAVTTTFIYKAFRGIIDRVIEKNKNLISVGGWALGGGLKKPSTKGFKITRRIKRFYRSSVRSLDFGGENPFDGDRMNYIVEEPKSMLQIIASSPLKAINASVLSALIAGTNGIGTNSKNTSMCAGLLIHSIPIITGVISKYYNIPAGNALNILISIVTRYSARRITGSAHYGFIEIIKDAAHLGALVKTIDTNTRSLIRVTKNTYAWAGGWYTYFRSFIYTSNLATRAGARELGIDTGLNVTEITKVNDSLTQIVKNGEPFYFTPENLEVLNLYKDLSTVKYDLLMKTLNHKDTLTDTLAKKYIDVSTKIHKMPQSPLSNEIAKNHLDYNLPRGNVTSHQDALLIAEKIKNSDVPNNVYEQPNILLEAEQIQEHMTLTGKLITFAFVCVMAFFGFKWWEGNKEYIFDTVNMAKMKLYGIFFQAQVVEVPNKPQVNAQQQGASISELDGTNVQNLYPNIQKPNIIQSTYNKIRTYTNEYFYPQVPTAPNLSNNESSVIESADSSSVDVNEEILGEQVVMRDNLGNVTTKDNLGNVTISDISGNKVVVHGNGTMTLTDDVGTSINIAKDEIKDISKDFGFSKTIDEVVPKIIKIDKPTFETEIDILNKDKSVFNNIMDQF